MGFRAKKKKIDLQYFHIVRDEIWQAAASGSVIFSHLHKLSGEPAEINPEGKVCQESLFTTVANLYLR
jgi:hypothetical protein